MCLAHSVRAPEAHPVSCLAVRQGAAARRAHALAEVLPDEDCRAGSQAAARSGRLGLPGVFPVVRSALSRPCGFADGILTSDVGLTGVVDSFGHPRLACGTSRIQICGPSFWCVCPKGFQQSGMGSRSWGISGFDSADWLDSICGIAAHSAAKHFRTSSTIQRRNQIAVPKIDIRKCFSGDARGLTLAVLSKCVPDPAGRAPALLYGGGTAWAHLVS